MAIVRHAVNEGIAEVSDEQAAELIASGSWVAADAPTKKSPAKKAARVHAKASSNLEG